MQLQWGADEKEHSPVRADVVCSVRFDEDPSEVIGMYSGSGVERRTGSNVLLVMLSNPSGVAFCEFETVVNVVAVERLAVGRDNEEAVIAGGSDVYRHRDLGWSRQRLASVNHPPRRYSAHGARGVLPGWFSCTDFHRIFTERRLGGS